MKKCKMCGLCCKLLLVPMRTNDKENILLGEMKTTHYKTVKHAGLTYMTYISKCKYLEFNLCTINDKKPNLCKKWLTPQYKSLWAKINPDCGLL